MRTDSTDSPVATIAFVSPTASPITETPTATVMLQEEKEFVESENPFDDRNVGDKDNENNKNTTVEVATSAPTQETEVTSRSQFTNQLVNNQSSGCSNGFPLIATLVGVGLLFLTAAF